MEEEPKLLATIPNLIRKCRVAAGAEAEAEAEAAQMMVVLVIMTMTMIEKWVQKRIERKTCPFRSMECTLAPCRSLSPSHCTNVYTRW